MREDNKGPSSVPLFGAAFLFVLFVAAAYLALVSQVALRSMAGHSGADEAAFAVRSDLVSLTIAQLAGMGTALFLGLRMFAPDESLSDALRLHPVRLRTLVLCLLAGACLQFPLAELSNVLHAFVVGPDSLEKQLALQQMIEARSLGRGVIVVLCIVAAVPMMEELFFRGLLAYGMAARHGRVIGVVASACLFGLAHFDPAVVIYATVAGLLLGQVALMTGSLWPSFAMHAAVNAMPVLLPEHVLKIRGFNVPSVTPLHMNPMLWGTGLVLGVCLLAFVRRIEYAAEP